MKLGLHSAILPEYTFEQVIDQASIIGFKTVELACWPFGKAERRYAGVSHINAADLDASKTAYILNYCQQKDVQIAALGYYPNPLDPKVENRSIYIEHLKTLIIAAKQLGIHRVSTFIGKDKDKTIEENLEVFEKVWPPIIDFAEQHEVWIGIENCPMYFTKDEWPGGLNLASSPHIWKQLFSIIDSEYFGLSYDPSHLYFQRMDYIKPIYQFRDKIKHIHLKDIKIYPDKIDEYGIFTYPLNYMAPKIPGHGGINWGSFISALQDIGYNEAACVEIEDKSFEGSLENILKAINLSYKHLNQFIE
ncbi:MAG: sugar phosphate isomerase/epimerase [Clostridia bacterium]|jgi:sugar phosphate isomerase/epimerase|nr:sugar phosphate isomerase/epimerase [Clostridia bacterium]